MKRLKDLVRAWPYQHWMWKLGAISFAILTIWLFYDFVMLIRSFTGNKAANALISLAMLGFLWRALVDAFSGNHNHE